MFVRGRLGGHLAVLRRAREVVQVGRSPVNGVWEHIAEARRMLEGVGRWLKGNWKAVDEKEMDPGGFLDPGFFGPGFFHAGSG